MALISIPSSSSSSNSCQSNFKHDVFISFRGEDTRYNFTSHLHKALRDKQIQTYIDYKLNRGDEISPSLLKAIEESKISVIIFSKDYASSRWCLQELVKILECKKTYGQIVIPVFYNVVPTDVRKQTGTFGDAFTKHDQLFVCSLVSWAFSWSKKQQQSLGQVQIWKDALKEAANLSGWDSSIIKDESVLIENIVKDISKKLNDMSSSDSKGLVGIDTKIEQIVSLLGREDVHSVGIWGMGGIGKTTLAQVVFNRISCQFEASYFVPNIREEFEKNGLNHVRRELLSAVLEDGNVNIGTASVSHAFTRNRLDCKKLLIVFDDVTTFQQIETLIGGFNCLNSQSRIIITTRDKQVFRNCRVNQVYEVQGLFHHEALELFHRYAFNENNVSEDYMELSKRVCEYAGGVPLALKVLGAFLCGRIKQVWVSALNKLERIDGDIQKVLKISYDGLDDEKKKIFLDIACCFKGKNKDFVINILDACGFSVVIGIDVLCDKSLISLSSDKSIDNMIITMHDLLQEMAREIVRQECEELGKRSRLWNYDDIYHVLTKGKGTKKIEAISLNMSSSNARDINLSPWAFAKMQKLRLLEFYVSDVRHNCGNKVHVDEGFKFVFNELMYLHWYGFPLKSLQSNFQSESLVILEMPNSNVEELWSSFPPPVNLKRIDLTGSKQLTSIPNCSGLKSLKEFDLSLCSKLKRLPELPNDLETLGIARCESLVEIPSSFKYLSKVKSLNLSGCKSLESIPNLRGWKSLKQLNCWRCSKLKMLPEVPNSIESLYLTEAQIEEFPPSFEDLHSLESLDLIDCSMLKSLPSSICKSKSLKNLSLNSCSKIDKLPDNIGNLESLRKIDARGTTIREIPQSISCLKRLEWFNLSGCKGEDGVGLILPPLSGLDNLKILNLSDCRIKEIPPSISCLKRLEWFDLQRCKGKDGVGLILPPLCGLDNLKILLLSDCEITELPDSLGCLTSLEYLSLAKNNFESIPGSIINLSKTWLRIDISNCERIKVLPKLRNWISISAVNCTSLEELPSPLFHSFNPSKVVIDFTNCLKLNRNSLNYFLECTVLQMQRLPSIVKTHRQIFGEGTFPASICYPENDIPEWFSFRSTGSFIDVKLPQHCFNYNFICLALSVVVTILDPDPQCDHQWDCYYRSSVVKYEHTVKSKDGDRYLNRINPLYSLFKVPYCGPNYMKSNHVIIGFGYCFDCELCDDEFSFRFYIEDEKKSDIEHINVVKCGVHLIFGLNLETSGDDAPQEIETYRITPRDQGIAALIKSVHQDWSSAAIRSAAVTTASPIRNIWNDLPTTHVKQVASLPSKANISTEEYVQLLCSVCHLLGK